MRWDPARYMEFSHGRLRPAQDLISRIDADPGSVWDLGCGTGSATVLLAERWPRAHVHGLDSSEEMLAVARARADITWVHGDLREWAPDRPVDVTVCNAVLQWVPGHLEVLPRLMGHTSVLALQVPRNFDAPSHVILRDVASSRRWRDRLGGVHRSTSAAPSDYYDKLAPLAGTVDLWETEYIHVLEGPDPVARWVAGTAALPYLEALGDDGTAFLEDYAAAVRDAYPRRDDGTTLFPFRRLFLVASR